MSAQPIDPRALKAVQEIRQALHPLATTHDDNDLARIIQSHFAESVNGKLLEAAKSSLKAFNEFGDNRCRFYHNGQGVPCGRCFECGLRSLEQAIALAQSQPPSMDKFDPACGDCDPCIGGRPDQCALLPTKTNMADELAEALRDALLEYPASHTNKNCTCRYCGLLARYDAQKGQS